MKDSVARVVVMVVVKASKCVRNTDSLACVFVKERQCVKGGGDGGS